MSDRTVDLLFSVMDEHERVKALRDRSVEQRATYEVAYQLVHVASVLDRIDDTLCLLVDELRQRKA